MTNKVEQPTQRLQHSSSRLFWSVLGGILSLALILLWLAPAEQTLGTGIKSVYTHVAFTWTGMTGLIVAGLVGLGAAIFNRSGLISWARTIAWVALAMFAAGLFMSMWAARVNWGAMFWQEPRTNSALQILALGLIVQVVTYWGIPDRLKGGLYLAVPAFLFWSVLTTPLVLHPGNAARASPSAAIRFTFLGLFSLFTLAAAWIVFHWQRTKRSQSESSS